MPRQRGARARVSLIVHAWLEKKREKGKIRGGAGAGGGGGENKISHRASLCAFLCPRAQKPPPGVFFANRIQPKFAALRVNNTFPVFRGAGVSPRDTSSAEEGLLLRRSLLNGSPSFLTSTPAIRSDGFPVDTSTHHGNPDA